MSVNYSHMVQSLFKDGQQILQTINPEQLTALHAAIGISGESGELLDAVKKYAIYNKPIDLVNLIEELGDLEFYLEALRQTFNITREDTLQKNIDKLSVRYSSGKYSDSQAQARADKI